MPLVTKVKKVYDGDLLILAYPTGEDTHIILGTLRCGSRYPSAVLISTHSLTMDRVTGWKSPVSCLPPEEWALTSDLNMMSPCGRVDTNDLFEVQKYLRRVAHLLLGTP